MKKTTISDDNIAKKLYSNQSKSSILGWERKKGLLTGVSGLDTDFGFPSGYYVILGNPGTGKSWFAIWLSRMFYRHNQVTSVYFSLEMPKPVMTMRILQQWSDLNKTEVETTGDTTHALDLLTDDIIVVDCFYEEDASQQTPENFEKWVDEYYSIGYRIFHFDHLHELFGANDNGTNQSVTEEWAKCFQKICKKYLDIWVFVYAQPNGAAASKKILRRTDIAGSKAITQKCDYFLSLNRNTEIDETTGLAVVGENDRIIILYLDKSRHTELSHIGFRLFFAPTGNFHAYAG